MHRDQYLGNTSPTTTSHAVRDFVVWLAANLGDSSLFAHEYTDRRSGTPWQFQGLQDACKQYQWSHKGVFGVSPGTDLASNDAALKALGNALHGSLSTANDSAAFTAAADVMKWGGVQAGNVRWLTINTNQLASLLTSTAVAFSNGNLADPILLNKDLRFNAGMTKVYSLLVKDFIIYDSRVGAALGWIVAKYCEEKQLPGVPAELAFPWAPSKEAPNAKSPKIAILAVVLFGFRAWSPARSTPTGTSRPAGFWQRFWRWRVPTTSRVPPLLRRCAAWRPHCS